MQKTILMMLLVVWSNNSIAEWVKVASSERGTYYINPSSIRSKGNKIKMWRLTDLNEAKRDANGNIYISYLEQNEYNCKEEQFRPISFQNYSEHMAEGKMVYFNSDGAMWQPIPPDSVAEILLKIACKKT